MSGKLIPETLLLASEPFAGLTAGRVADALARGLAAGGRLRVERVPLDVGPSLETRLRASRAVVIATARLDEGTLRGSPAFEIATRARQAGVPAYAVSADDRLDAFGARMLDLQLVLEARDERALAAAGRRVAQVA